MDFKKNWAKLAMAAIAGILGLLFLISIFVSDSTMAALGLVKMSGLDVVKNSFAGFSMFYLIPALFFLGTCAYILLKLFDMDYAKYILLGVGALNLILFVISLIDSGTFPGISNVELFTRWAPLVIFALFPLIKGISKVCCADEAPAAKASSSRSTAAK